MCPGKDLQAKVHSDFIYKKKKLEIIQMFVSGEWANKLYIRLVE